MKIVTLCIAGLFMVMTVSSSPNIAAKGYSSNKSNIYNVTNNVYFHVMDSGLNPLSGVKIVIFNVNGDVISIKTTGKNGEAKQQITVPTDKRYFWADPNKMEPRGTVSAIAFKEGYLEQVIFEIPVSPSGSMQEVHLAPIVHGQRNEPAVTCGNSHHLEILSLVDKYSRYLKSSIMYENTTNQARITKTEEAINKAFAQKNFKLKDNIELTTQDFETAYRLGKSFLNDYYSQRSGRSKIDFSKYITNENLLKYSNKRMAVENRVLDIKEVSIGLNKAQFIGTEKSYYLVYTIAARDSRDGGFGEAVEILVSSINGKIVISDWYIRWGAGSSCFDEKFRPKELVNSPKVWDNEEYVKRIFKEAEIN